MHTKMPGEPEEPQNESEDRTQLYHEPTIKVQQFASAYYKLLLTKKANNELENLEYNIKFLKVVSDLVIDNTEDEFLFEMADLETIPTVNPKEAIKTWLHRVLDLKLRKPLHYGIAPGDTPEEKRANVTKSREVVKEENTKDIEDFQNEFKQVLVNLAVKLGVPEYEQKVFAMGIIVKLRYIFEIADLIAKGRDDAFDEYMFENKKDESLVQTDLEDVVLLRNEMRAIDSEGGNAVYNIITNGITLKIDRVLIKNPRTGF